VADTGLLPIDRRLEALRILRDRILGVSKADLDLSRFQAAQGSPAERALLLRWEEAIALLGRMQVADIRLIRNVLTTITLGQEHDLTRFAAASAERIVALGSDEELDAYTYEVAGCVGEFWTEICRTHLFPSVRMDYRQLLIEGILFGKGLQLVNILRDMPADLRQGRCYLPESGLRALGLVPANLLHAEAEPVLRPLYDIWLERAQSYLAAGWTYTNRLPWRLGRVRLACAWPILIGVQTLSLLRVGNILDPAVRLKVPRKNVKRLIWSSIVAYPFPSAWNRLFRSAAQARPLD
jgi:farnesyl-diphosphate farnesyltransferase